ncbi:MAG: DUF2029 domain-containing protein [Rhodospirillales bacterium]|nr:DUF2029 domain-containing protein [Rhodospirillales bacterium]
MEIYQPVILNLYQRELAPGFLGFFPFPYPPPFLFLLWPLGTLNYLVARLLWSTAGMVLFGWSVWRCLPAMKFWRGYMVALAFLAPASFNNLLTGETGYFTSAALLSGLRLMQRNALATGGLFGLLALKPQLCVLLPFAVIGTRAWRAAFVAFFVAVVLAGASCLAYGVEIWPVWLRALHHYQVLSAQNAFHLSPKMTTLAALAGSFQLPPLAIQAVQLIGLLVIGTVCLRVFLLGNRELAICSLLAGSFAVTPHAYFYDTPVMTVALYPVLCLELLSASDIVLIVLVVLAPLFQASSWLHGASSLVYIWLCLRLAQMALGAES